MTQTPSDFEARIIPAEEEAISTDEEENSNILRSNHKVSLDEAADRLKERIYVTFTALAVLVSLGTHDEVTAGGAARTLALTVAGTILAVLVADFIAHLAVHGRLHTREELRHGAAVASSAIGAVVLPFLFLGAAALGMWETDTALTASQIALIVALILFGWIAVRRIRMPWWQRLIALGAEAALGLVVVLLESLAHE